MDSAIAQPISSTQQVVKPSQSIVKPSTPLAKLYRHFVRLLALLPCLTNQQTLTLYALAVMRFDKARSTLSSDAIEKLNVLHVAFKRSFLVFLKPIMFEWEEFVQKTCRARCKTSAYGAAKIQTSMHEFHLALWDMLSQYSSSKQADVRMKSKQFYRLMSIEDPELPKLFREHIKTSSAILRAFVKTEGEAFLAKIAEFEATLPNDQQPMDISDNALLVTYEADL